MTGPIRRCCAPMGSASPRRCRTAACLPCSNAHIEYFPHSVAEVWDELDAHQARQLDVAEGVVLHYRQALYYFVHKDNAPLAAAIEQGLRRAIADGTMGTLFDRHHGAAIARAGLARRTVIALANPTVPAATPLAERALWFVPGAAQ
jgi:hypothetical protein